MDDSDSKPLGVPPGADMDVDRNDRDREPRRDDRDDRDQRGAYERRDDRPRRASPPPRPANAPIAQENNCVGIFGLSIRTTEADLRDEFGKCGRVDNVVIVYDQRLTLTQTERSRGFGFITMDSIDSAKKAIERISGMDLHGRRVRVDYSSTTRAHAPTPGEYRGRKSDDYGYRGSFSDRGGGYDDRRYDDRDRRPPPPRRDDRDRDDYYRRDRDDYYRRRSPSPRRYRDDRDERPRDDRPRRRSLSRSRSPRRRSRSPRRD